MTIPIENVHLEILECNAECVKTRFTEWKKAHPFAEMIDVHFDRQLSEKEPRFAILLAYKEKPAVQEPETQEVS
jgi:hypothetical protein